MGAMQSTTTTEELTVSTTTQAVCTECGASPCYHICPNSVHFYSPERERFEDAFYGDDDIRERYAAETFDAEVEYGEDDGADDVDDFREDLSPASPRPISPDDIPF